ncbi:glycerol-3-phosphate acyltransferase 2, mitochondrial-like isoform X1 [Phalacrocorax carbo]|uniref:glycerol-3-phosphate acyltransferase 2, mitochondrial-like isoform X1 n=1 Tax=Phalacrocorax carbo TaxID=9209 RepID=UPI00311A1507
MKAWICDSEQKLEIFIPFLGKSRPFLGRCCQTCTPKSWDDFYYKQVSSIRLRNTIRVTEEDTRYRGWLVRRVCGFLAVWEWKIPADTPRDLPARICRNRRVRDVATGRSRGLRGDSESHQRWKEKVLEILAEIQAPLSPLLLRLCNWALLKLLNHLFFSVQLHQGQLEMVLKAARTPDVPLVFLSTHKSQLDGLLLSSLLFSQGLGVPRVTVGSQLCSPRLRALLSRLGGIFLPSRMVQMLSDWDEELPGAVLAAYVEEVLRSRQPLLIFLEEPSVTQCLSAPAWEWLALVYQAMRDGAIRDVILVPVGIAYDVAPGGLRQRGARGARPLGIGACLWAACRALCRIRGCARVDFAQPYSLQEFAAQNLTRQSCKGELLEELLLPTILGRSPSQLDGKKAEIWGPGPTTAAGLEAEEEMLVTKLGLHSLSDGVACSAIMAVGITSTLLLHKHREGVFFSQLMLDFAWLLEEILLRQRDVGFSGQLRVLVQHSLLLLESHLTLYHLSPLGDILVVPRVSAEALSELGHHSAALLPVFASEAVGACAILALLMDMLPFLETTVRASGIVFSHDELYHETLELLLLLPPNLLGFQPCQSLDLQSLDIVDKLILCGLLEAEEVGASWDPLPMLGTAGSALTAASRPGWEGTGVPVGWNWRPPHVAWLESECSDCDLALWPFHKGSHWVTMDFSDSDSEDQVPRRYFKLKEPQGSPGFLLFLCRLLSPMLRTYARAVAFLDHPSWPQPEAACGEALLQFLAEEDGFEHPSRSVALSSLQTFKEMGVLEEVQTPAGPLLHLGQPFQSSESRKKLETFIQRFALP